MDCMPNLLYAQPEEVIAHVVNRIPGGLVILGDPGAGKTTFAQFLANSIANLGKDISACTISLRDFDNRRRSGSQSVAEYLSWIARERLQVHGSTDQWEMALSRGALVVIFDGLDELTDVRLRVEIADIIEAYVHAYPAAPAVVTCRIEGF